MQARCAAATGWKPRSIWGRLQATFHPGCVDFTGDWDAVCEACAMCDEALLETYLETGTVTDGNIRAIIAARKLFPCCFGSGLKLTVTILTYHYEGS